jgi:hypothetical protein
VSAALIKKWSAREPAYFRVGVFLAVAFVALDLLMISPVGAESRLYHLQVTLRSGERYETISVTDPFSHCSRTGGEIIYQRDYSLVYSPQMRIKVVSSWIEPAGDLSAEWANILRARGMLQNHNHKALPQLQPLTMADMRRPE